jgi:GTP-dependent phosphoenolpyruvate carboxykinase
MGDFKVGVNLIQPQRGHFGILAGTSAKTDKTICKIFEETLSR